MAVVFVVVWVYPGLVVIHSYNGLTTCGRFSMVRIPGGCRLEKRLTLPVKTFPVKSDKFLVR